MSPLMLTVFFACGAPDTESSESSPTSPSVTHSTPTWSDTGTVPSTDSGVVGTGAGHSSPLDTSSKGGNTGGAGGWLYDLYGYATYIEVSIDGVTASKDLPHDPFHAGVASSKACVSSTGIGMVDDSGDYVVYVVFEGTKSLLDTANPQLPVDTFEYYPSLMIADFDGRGLVVPSGGTWSVSLGPKETTLELRDASMCFLDELGKNTITVDHADCTPTDLVEVRIVGVLGDTDLDGLAEPGMMLESGEPLCYVPFW